MRDASLTAPQTGECEVNPQPPTNLVASAVNGSDDSVELSWDAPNAPLSMPGGPQLGVLSPLATILPTATYGTITYEIRRNGVLLKSTTNTFYTDTGLEPDTEYTYTIAAVNNRGGSTLVSVTVRTNPSPASGETLDTDFNGDLSFSSIRAVVELPNGNLLGGGASVPKLVEMTQTRGLVAKYWSVLGTYVALNSTVRALAIVDGKAVAGGEFTNGPTPYLVRLNADGTRDTTFTPPTLNGIVTTLLTQDDGKLLVGGNFTDVAEDPALDRLIRLEADGTLDTTFTPPPLNNTVNVIKATGGGKYFVGGAFTDSGYPRLVRVESNGARDTSYSNSANNVVYCITELTDGDLLLGSNTRIRRLNSDGTLDTSWADTAFSNQVFAVQPLSNGQFLVGGSGIFSGATGYYGRLNSDGTRDTEFTPPSGIASYVFDIKPDGDGYLIMGQFSNVGGDPNNDGIIRVN